MGLLDKNESVQERRIRVIVGACITAYGLYIVAGAPWTEGRYWMPFWFYIVPPIFVFKAIADWVRGGKQTAVPTMAISQAVPGWYPDPAGGPAMRWWDGYRWTESLQAS